MSVRKLKISKNFQGCFTVQLSMFILLPAFFLSAPTALIEYHVCHYLSTTFLIFFIFFTSSCLFNQKQETSMMRTEKEGFEPSRRVTDLHPFQGCPFSLLGTSPNVSLRYDTFAPVIFHIQLLGKQKHLSA